MTRLYLAGPMTGAPCRNYPLFNAEAARLRALGYDVVNPAECGLPERATWAQFMRADITALLTCDAIALLAGWHHSKGASLENHIAVSLGMPSLYAAAIVDQAPPAPTPATDWAAA